MLAGIGGSEECCWVTTLLNRKIKRPWTLEIWTVDSTGEEPSLFLLKGVVCSRFLQCWLCASPSCHVELLSQTSLGWGWSSAWRLSSLTLCTQRDGCLSSLTLRTQRVPLKSSIQPPTPFGLWRAFWKWNKGNLILQNRILFSYFPFPTDRWNNCNFYVVL